LVQSPFDVYMVLPFFPTLLLNMLTNDYYCSCHYSPQTSYKALALS
jgi:hypothetical protein